MTSGPTDDALIADLHERIAVRVAQWRPGASVGLVRPLTGGASSLTFLVDLLGVDPDEALIVVKVAPPGLEPVRNRDVLRQARVQKALQGTARQLAPDVLFSDAGLPTAVPPFIAMNLVPGKCLEPILVPVAARPTPELVRARYLDAAETLAQLHRAVPSEIGLGDEPLVDLAQEVGRWTRAFETLPDDLRVDHEPAARALLATQPPALTPVVNHGDYRLGNTLCEGAHVEAIIDWEIWSVGDPRVDLAWLTFFTDDAGHAAAEPGPPAGTPTREEVIDHYLEHRGVPMPDLVWFHALTRYKEAAATGLLLKRAAKSGRPLSGGMARMVPALPELIEETLHLLGH
jgi:aminoglycoside phosphotransferase (APT) family kinase protein